jgi:hypothetical protein
MPSNSEEGAIASGRGKWSQPNVPHRGWRCIEIEDLGKAHRICEMCEAQSIRFVHYMANPAYDDVLACGCVCGGHMEQDLGGARARDQSMRSRGAKRTRWLTRRWRVSSKGNEWIEAEGYRVTIFPSGSRWRSAVVAAEGSYKHFSRRTYATENEAKLAAFDLITQMLLRRSAT